MPNAPAPPPPSTAWDYSQRLAASTLIQPVSRSSVAYQGWACCLLRRLQAAASVVLYALLKLQPKIMPHEERTPAQTNQNRSAARPGNEHLGLSRIGTPLSGTEQLKRFKTANNTPNIYEEEGDQYVFDGIMLAERLAELAARERAHEAVINVLQNISVRERPRAITVILNPKTGKTYTGKSRGISSIETLHPWVKSLLPQVSLEGWDTHNCAEVHALDTLFKDVFGNVTTNGDNPQEMVLIEELLNGLEMHTVWGGRVKQERIRC